MRHLALIVLLLGCGEEPGFRAASSTIVRGQGGQLWLTSPDDDAVVAIDPESLEETARVEVEGAPEQLAFVGDALLVTLGQRAELAWIEDGRARYVATPCGGTRAVVADGEGGAFVSCPWDDLVLRVDPGGVRASFTAPGRPTALAVNGARLAVTASRLGVVRIVDFEGHGLDERALSSEAGIAAVQLDALAPMGADFAGVYQRVDHDSDRARPPERGGYGSVVDGSPRIEPLLHGACAGAYARFDGGARVFSGPSALAVAGDVVWVAHLQTGNVAALRCTGEAELPRLATFEVGRGPRGLTLSDDGRTAWVDVGFDHAVARLALPEVPDEEGPVLGASLERTRALGETRLSEPAMRGRALFFDADDTHLTPSGVVTCGTCHPGGGEDGLTWFLHTAGIAPKVRRTPPAWAAREELAPFHWDGALPDAATLSHATIRELMEGDGLLVDTDAMAAWMNEAPIPPGAPHDGAEGRRIFEERGCAECHAGPLLSDARSHDVLAPSPDPLAHLARSQTPTLLGVRARPPYFHDGRAPTLLHVLTDHGERHGRTRDLDDAQRAALVRYLQTL
ncbi:MAG: hypothetical protein SangKO_087460 [Sandaracinaceae bacterium]